MDHAQPFWASVEKFSSVDSNRRRETEGPAKRAASKICGNGVKDGGQEKGAGKFILMGNPVERGGAGGKVRWMWVSFLTFVRLNEKLCFESNMVGTFFSKVVPIHSIRDSQSMDFGLNFARADILWMALRQLA